LAVAQAERGKLARKPSVPPGDQASAVLFRCFRGESQRRTKNSEVNHWGEPSLGDGGKPHPPCNCLGMWNLHAASVGVLPSLSGRWPSKNNAQVLSGRDDKYIVTKRNHSRVLGWWEWRDERG